MQPQRQLEFGHPLGLQQPHTPNAHREHPRPPADENPPIMAVENPPAVGIGLENRQEHPRPVVENGAGPAQNAQVLQERPLAVENNAPRPPAVENRQMSDLSSNAPLLLQALGQAAQLDPRVAVAVIGSVATPTQARSINHLVDSVNAPYREPSRTRLLEMVNSD